MSILVSKTFLNDLARDFFTGITSGSNNYYIFQGKTDEWENDSNPPPPVDTYGYELDTRRDIISIKKVGQSDVSYVYPRINWIQGNVYDQYDNRGAFSPPVFNNDLLVGSMFYVLTDEFKVYKCISNNYGAASTIKPTSTTTTIFETQDGYKWKFLYRISPELRDKFLTDKWVPVTDVSTVGGMVTKVRMISQGAGYTYANINVLGDGTGATATSTIVGGKIVAINIQNPGQNYTTASIQIIGDGIVPASATAIITASSELQDDVQQAAVHGELSYIEVTNAGQGYTTNNTRIKILGDGTGAIAVPQIVLGQIKKINIINGGRNYSFASVVIEGDGINASAAAIISPRGGHGSDLISELYSSNVMIYNEFPLQSQGDLIYNNDYRQVGIIKNIQKADGTNFTDATGRGTYKGILSSSVNIVVDDILASPDGLIRLLVASINSATREITFINRGFSLPTEGQTLVVQRTSATVTFTGLQEPEFNKFSGTFVYLDNRVPIVRSPQQLETVRTIISF